jgi:hypothetical protein
MPDPIVSLVLGKGPNVLTLQADRDTAIRYHIVAERVDLRALREERAALASAIAAPPERDEALLERAKAQDEATRQAMLTRLADITKALGG